MDQLDQKVTATWISEWFRNIIEQKSFGT